MRNYTKLSELMETIGNEIRIEFPQFGHARNFNQYQTTRLFMILLILLEGKKILRLKF